MNKLTAVLITKNEQDKIESCLRSIEWVNEIIVVDDESIDSTVSLAKKYTNKIYNRKLDNFASQKNYGINKAQFDWILIIDSDEQVSAELKKEIKDLLQNKDLKDGYLIPFKNYLGEKWLHYGGLYPDYHLRLFRKDKGKFRNPIHEEIEMENVGYLKNPIEHKTYNSYKNFWKKVKKYSFIEAKINHKKYSFLSYFLPIKKFLGVYFKKQGFRDGFAGLVNAIFLSIYDFRVYYFGRRD